MESPRKMPSLGAACLAAVLLLGGCSNLQPVPAQTMNEYTLDAHFQPAAERQGTLTLLVAAPTARPGFDSRRMVYLQKPHELAHFAKSQWVDSPARMLAPLLVQALESAGAFRAVVQTPTAATADLRLDTEIIRLQQEFLTTPSQVHLTLRAQLTDLATNRVVATQEFDVKEAAPSDDPYGGVVAANRAVEKVLGEVGTFCRTQSASLAKH